MSCTLGPLVNEANEAAIAAYEICEVDPSGLELEPAELQIVEKGSWCSYQPTYSVPDIAGYLPTLVTQVTDKVYSELWANLQNEISMQAASAALVYSTKIERVAATEAMAGKIDASYARWESGSSALATNVQTALASQGLALSQQILATEASLDGKITANSEFYQTSLASVGETMAASGVLNSVTLADGKKVVSGFRSQASSTTGSEFTVFADTFKILNRVPNGSGGYDYSSVVAPFTVQNDTVYIGAVNTSEPQITYLGEFASAPSTTGLDRSTTYKNTTDGNTYLYNGTEWTIWLPAAEGQGVVSAFIFTRAAKQPDTPSGGSWARMLPTSLNVTFGGSSADADGATGIVWSDGVPADNGKPLWTATKWFTSNNQLPYEGSLWNTPTVLADTPKQNFQWNTSLSLPGDPGPTGTSNGWTDSATNAVWIAGSTTFNHATQSWSNWSIAKVKGEDGIDGTDGSDGSDGAAGSRGAGKYAGAAASAAWNDTKANSIMAAVGGKVYQDELTLYYPSTNPTWTETRYWTGASWATVAAVINGNLLLKGSLIGKDMFGTGLRIVDATSADDGNYYNSYISSPNYVTLRLNTTSTNIGGQTLDVLATNYRAAKFYNNSGVMSTNNSTITIDNAGGGYALYVANGSVFIDDGLTVNGTVTGISYSDVGAAASSHTHTYSDVGAAAASHSHTASSITSWSSLSMSGSFGCINTGGAWFNSGSNAVGINSQVGATSSYGFQTNGKIKSVLYNGFTGSHLGFMTTEPVVGDIVSTTGKVYHYDVNENYAVLETVSAAKDKRVFGVVSDYATEDIASKLEVDTLFYDTVAITTMEDIVTEELDAEGEIVEVIVQQPRTEYVRVLKDGYADTVANILAEASALVYTNSVGEGGINVCSEGGNIAVGDYICSSNVLGKGMKQDDDLLHNYTVAKALEAVDWSTEELTTKMIACTYHCG